MRLAFFHRISRQWDGQTVDHEPLGGTQTALTYLSRALVRLGHDVHVFGTPAVPGSFAGVTYHSTPALASFLRQHPVDALISVVSPDLLRLGLPVKQHLFWSHNDYRHFAAGEAADLHAAFAADLATRAHKVIAVSDWHRDHLQRLLQLPDGHVRTLPNGIDLASLPPVPTGLRAKRLIYTSAPDRGLDVLLALFPAIRARVPAAELLIYGSFATWGMPEAWTADREQDLRRQADQPGVRWLPPMAKPALLDQLGSARVLAYPSHGAPGTQFLAETSCLAALEAQAMGVPVVTSHSGALPETVIDGVSGHVLAEPVGSAAFAVSFVEHVVRLLTDDAHWAALSQAGRRHVQTRHDWDQLAQAWVTAIADWQDASPTIASQAPFAARFPAPQVSVIIPTYNRADNLRHCLESLTKQDHPAFEVLVCDDGSSDDTYQVAQAFTSRLNLRYCWQPDHGFRAGAARNMGLQQARGKYTVLLDSDLWVPPTFLSAHVAALDREAGVGVNSYVYRTSAHRDVTGLRYEDLHERLADVLVPDHRDRYQLFERPHAVDEAYFLDSNAISFRTKDLVALGGFDESFVGWGHEDTDLGYKMGAKGFKLRFLKDGAISYHLHHPIVANKEAEQQANWERMRQKWRLDTFYVPLGQLDVHLPVALSDGEDRMARCQIKVGQRLPFLTPWIELGLETGVVRSIDWRRPPTEEKP